jgi:tetratricopeptide (TPR) repeat protein
LAVLWLAVLSTSLPSASAQQARNGCGELANAYGPYDYRTDRDKLPIVEGAHFTPAVEALVRATTGYLGQDIDYTLRAFPNHHRALLSMMRLAERAKTPQAAKANYSVECYFDRALRFRPEDTTARMLFATYLNKNRRTPEAKQQVDLAVTQAGDNAFTHYNAGLMYLEMKDYDAALKQAHRAQSLGFIRPELRDGLKAAGKWVEPPADPASAPASSAGAAVAPAETQRN